MNDLLTAMLRCNSAASPRPDEQGAGYTICYADVLVPCTPWGTLNAPTRLNAKTHNKVCKMAKSKKAYPSSKKATKPKAVKRQPKGGKVAKIALPKAPGHTAVIKKHVYNQVAPPARVRRVTIGKFLSSADEIGILKSGAPVQLAQGLQNEIELTQRELSAALGISPRTLATRFKAKTFGTDETDRILQRKRVLEQAVSTFEGDKAAAVSWLHAKNRALAGSTPIELLATGTGTRAGEIILGRMEHGIYS